MKKRVFTTALALFVFFSGICAYAADKVPFSVSRAAKSVVRVTVNNSFGREEFSGIVIGKGRKSKYILTSKHATDGYTGDILVGTAADENIKATGITAISQDLDLAVIELSEDITSSMPAKLKKSDIKEGSSVYTLGYYSRDDNEKISEGTVNSKNPFTVAGSSVNTEVYVISAAVNEQNNGGALADKSGAVSGVNIYDGNQAQNKAVTSGEVINFLDDNDLPYKKATILFLLLEILFAAAVIAAIVYFIIRKQKEKKENAPAIIGVSGEYSGSKITLGSESINIGRDAKSCQVIVMNDSKVSRCHCSVRYDGMRNMFAITDLSSTHGTYINETQKLEPKVPVYVNNGTVFRVGDGVTSFRVVIGGGN